MLNCQKKKKVIIKLNLERFIGDNIYVGWYGIHNSTNGIIDYSTSLIDFLYPTNSTKPFPIFKTNLT